MARRHYLFLTSALVLAAIAIAVALSFPGNATSLEHGQPEAPPLPEAAAAFEAALTNVHETVSPSVVNIQVVVAEQAFPFSGTPEREVQGLGSGFVWDEQGHIVTNHHVVANATEVTVTFMDGITVSAEVIGADRDSDLAVLRVDPERADLQPIAIGDSRDLQVGQIAIAIGNPFGLAGTMTYGIVSALGRALPVSPSPDMPPNATGLFQIPDIVQTDAAINPGNSGGALVNVQGELIGVPTAIVSPQLGAGGGIGFAVSSTLVQRVVPSLIETGSYQHPFIGVSMIAMAPPIAREMGLPSEQRGALIADLIAGAPADRAGLEAGTRTIMFQGQEVTVGGDVVIAIEDQSVHDPSDLISYLALNVSPGETVTLTILRDGDERTIEVTVDARRGAGT